MYFSFKIGGGGGGAIFSEYVRRRRESQLTKEKRQLTVMTVSRLIQQKILSHNSN